METIERVDEYRRRVEERALAPLSGTGAGYRVLVAGLLLVVAWGLYAYTTQLREGLIVTGMRDRILWGFYITLFVFFIGISHAGTLISAILRVTHAGWRTPITRMAEFITVVALTVGGIMPIVDLGRPDRILNLVTYGRWQSPIVWDVLSITTYITGSIIYLYLPLIPDLALCRDRLGRTGSGWRQRFFHAFALGWRGTPVQRERLGTAIGIMMVLIIPVAVSVHTVVSWIFAMTLREPWNNPMFGAYFVAGAIYSGIAAIILMMALLRRIYHLEAFITAQHFVNLGYLLAAFVLIMLYFNVSEYLTTGYKMNAEVAFHFHQLFAGEFSAFYWSYLLGGLVLPGLLVLVPATRTVAGIVGAAVLVTLGMWVERFFIVVGGLRVPLMPYAPASYVPTWVEWSIMAGAFAAFALVIAFFVKLFPIVSVWEMVEHHEAQAVRAPQALGATVGARVAGLLLAVALAAAVAPGAAAAAPGPSALGLHAPSSIRVGQRAALEARLVDARGTPVVGARVEFYDLAEFSGVSGEVRLGEATTGPDGRAVLPWVPRRQGEVRLEARFAGSARHAPGRATASVEVGAGPPAYHETAPSAPWIVWPLMGVLGAVWATYLGVMVLLWLVAREGRTTTAPASERWYRVPLTGALAVGAVGALLLFQVVWRPWSDANVSWRTSLNISEVVPPDYVRTPLAYVTQIAAAPTQGRPVAPPAEDGRALFVARGCASCHGLDARGGPVGPPIVGLAAPRVMEQVRSPVGQMPRYAPDALSDEELEQMAAYLSGLQATRSTATRQ